MEYTLWCCYDRWWLHPSNKYIPVRGCQNNKMMSWVLGLLTSSKALNMEQFMNAVSVSSWAQISKRHVTLNEVWSFAFLEPMDSPRISCRHVKSGIRDQRESSSLTCFIGTRRRLLWRLHLLGCCCWRTYVESSAYWRLADAERQCDGPTAS